jgi:hypothetical protein
MRRALVDALLEKISDRDRDRSTVISRTLCQTGVFNEVVRVEREV